MAGTLATFEHDSVNSGTAVQLHLTHTGPYSWKNIVDVKPVPGKDSLAAADSPTANEFRSLVEADHQGYENPVIRIEGAIEHNASPDTNEMTLDFLQQFARLKFDGTKGDTNVKGAIKVTIPFGVKATDAYIKDHTGTNSYFYALIKDYSWDTDQSSDGHHFIRYNITLVETLTS